MNVEFIAWLACLRCATEKEGTVALLDEANWIGWTLCRTRCLYCGWSRRWPYRDADLVVLASSHVPVAA
jgi:RNase P subunit RPR2